jgi:hypothetical protein
LNTYALYPSRSKLRGIAFKSETAAAHPRAASCGASKAPPHENGTR